MAVDVCLIDKKSLCGVTPDLAYDLTFIIVIEELVRIILLPNHRFVIGQNKSD